MDNKCFHRNATLIGLKKIGDGDLQFNIAKNNLSGTAFPPTMLDNLLGAPITIVAYGPDNAPHNVQMGVVEIPGRGRELQISQLNEMKQAYNWNASTSVSVCSTSVSVCSYSSGVRSGTKTHKLVFFAERVGRSGSCEGCGANV